MVITPHTKIAAILKCKPEALEAIVSISPKFDKLRNPFLRKVLAGRTSIVMASKLGGCLVEDFFNKLQPLGFEIDKAAVVTEADEDAKPVPDFLKNIQPGNMIEWDVRPDIETGKDPLNIIVHKVKAMQTGQVLKIINSFEPAPLIHLLGKQGFESYTEMKGDEQVNTYFYKKSDRPFGFAGMETIGPDGWDEVINRFKGKLETVDVRELEMPLPMHVILEKLETLPLDKALFVYHKRIPVFLLPELEERAFSFRIKEITEGEVYLLIYKD